MRGERKNGAVCSTRSIAARLPSSKDLVDERFEFIEESDVPGAVRFAGEDWYSELVRRLGEVWADPPGELRGARTHRPG